jgi:hypothetical protein
VPEPNSCPAAAQTQGEPQILGCLSAYFRMLEHSNMDGIQWPPQQASAAAPPQIQDSVPCQGIGGFQAPLSNLEFKPGQHPGPSQNRPGPIVSQADLIDGPKAAWPRNCRDVCEIIPKGRAFILTTFILYLVPAVCRGANMSDMLPVSEGGFLSMSSQTELPGSLILSHSVFSPPPSTLQFRDGPIDGLTAPFQVDNSIQVRIAKLETDRVIFRWLSGRDRGGTGLRRVRVHQHQLPRFFIPEFGLLGLGDLGTGGRFPAGLPSGSSPQCSPGLRLVVSLGGWVDVAVGSLPSWQRVPNQQMRL